MRSPGHLLEPLIPLPAPSISLSPGVKNLNLLYFLVELNHSTVYDVYLNTLVMEETAEI